MLKLIPVGIGLVLLFASMLESIAFLNKWVGFVAFEVDSSGHYFPFNTFTQLTANFQGFRYAAIVLVVLSMLFSFIVSCFKRGVGWLTMVLSS
jgi:hypothetical protein